MASHLRHMSRFRSVIRAHGKSRLGRARSTSNIRVQFGYLRPDSNRFGFKHRALCDRVGLRLHHLKRFLIDLDHACIVRVSNRRIYIALANAARKRRQFRVERNSERARLNTRRNLPAEIGNQLKV